MTASLRHRLGWTLPALARIVEYGAVLVLVGASPWTFALLATIAYHHYDVVYRPRTRGHAPPRWLNLGGWPVRVAAIVADALAVVVVFAAAVMTVTLAAVYVIETWTDIRRARRSTRTTTDPRVEGGSARTNAEKFNEGNTL